MTKFGAALDETMKQFGIKGTTIAELASLQEQQVSEFRRGIRGLKTENLERVIEALPPEARHFLFFKVFVRNMSDRDISNLLSAIALELRNSDEVTHLTRMK